MSENTNLSDLNSYLFKQMRILNDENLSKEETQLAITKAQAITNVAETIIKMGNLHLRPQSLCKRQNGGQKQLPKLLTSNSGGENGEKV